MLHTETFSQKHLTLLHVKQNTKIFVNHFANVLFFVQPRRLNAMLRSVKGKIHVHVRVAQT